MTKSKKMSFTAWCKKQPWWFGWLVGYALVLLGSAAVVYYWRVIFSPLPLPAGMFTLQVALVASVVFGIVFYIAHFLKGRICVQAAACIFATGLLFCFASAPMQVPDENRHFLRANAISHGAFFYSGEQEFTNDVALLVNKFPAFYNKDVQFKRAEMIPTAFAEYHTALEEGTKAEVDAPIMFVLLPFLPQALFMAIARLFGFTALGQMYAARIANLLLYSLLCYKTFRNCDKYRGVFIAAAMLPLSIFMAASCSYDSLVLSLSYLMISYFCKKEFTNLDVIAFCVALSFASYIKLNSIVLVAILLLIPKERWKSSANPWLVTGGILLAGLFFTKGLSWLDWNVLKSGYPVELPRGSGDAANPLGQQMFVLQNPFKFLMILVFGLVENAGYVGNLGIFGWLDIDIQLVSIVSLVLLGAASALGIQQKEDTKATGAAALFLAVGGYFAAVMTAMYLYETDYQSIRVTGAQPRYFLPAILMLFMLLSILLGKAVQPKLLGSKTVARTESITLWIAVAVGLLAAVLLFESTFIGQWFTKSEGGWKMVNIFGWQIG